MGRRGQSKPWSGDLGGPLEYRALISPQVGRENRPLPPGAETHAGPRGETETQPMLPGRSAQLPGSQQKWS